MIRNFHTFLRSGWGILQGHHHPSLTRAWHLLAIRVNSWVLAWEPWGCFMALWPPQNFQWQSPKEIIRKTQNPRFQVEPQENIDWNTVISLKNWRTTITTRGIARRTLVTEPLINKAVALKAWTAITAQRRSPVLLIQNSISFFKITWTGLAIVWNQK